MVDKKKHKNKFYLLTSTLLCAVTISQEGFSLLFFL